jgi:tetratricopeptide (TPR) repeat protein
MQRDALDNCWYMFAKYYLANHGYTYDWNTLGAYYQIFEYLVNYWKKKYSSKFIEVNYETLVYHPQQALKPIADHLGISEHAFDLSGLHHFEVGHWRYYEKHLVSLVAALNQTLVVRSEPSNRDKIIAQLSHNAAVYIQQADFSSVKQISNVLIEINPNLYYGYQLLGIVAYQQGEFDQALAWFEKGLQLEPTQALLHQNMAMVLKELGQEEEAKKHLATAESASKVNHVNHPIVFVPNEREFLLSAYAAPVDVVDEFEKRMLMQGKIKEDHSTDSFMTRSWDQYFSDLSFGRYRGYHMRAWHYLYKNIALIEHIMSLQQPLVRILDLGCSSGYFRRFLEGNIDPQDRRRFFYWGLDVRADCLQKALKDVDDIESGAPGNTVPSSFVIQDTQFGLPYKDDVFDIVVNFEMLKYLPIEQGKKLLHDVHRVMNKKGVFVLSTTYNSNQPGFMQEVPFERIEKMLVDSGFQILQRRGSQVQFSFLKANLAERHKAMVEDLLKVHPPEMVGAMIAPLYPQLSEQVTFISKKIN